MILPLLAQRMAAEAEAFVAAATAEEEKAMVKDCEAVPTSTEEVHLV